MKKMMECSKKTFIKKQFLTLVLAAYATSWLSACASKPATKVDTLITTSADVNPDIQGRPSPVVIRLFQLKNINAFRATDYSVLTDRPNELGEDLLKTEELILPPSGSQRMMLELTPETKYLAAVASYRDVDHSKWRGNQEPGVRNIRLFEIPILGIKRQHVMPLLVKVEKADVVVTAPASIQELDFAEKVASTPKKIGDRISSELAKAPQKAVNKITEDVGQAATDKVKAAIPVPSF